MSVLLSGSKKYIAVDVETTGTVSYVDHIVELGAVYFEGGEEVDSFNILVNPGVPMPEEATRVNGISDEMLKNCPPLSAVELARFSDFCNQGNFLVAHNAKFDYQFLLSAYEKHRCHPPVNCMLDTYQLAKKVFPGLGSYKLSNLLNYLKIRAHTLHRAQDDARSCGRLFESILKKISAQGGSSDVKSLMNLCGKGELKFPQLKAKQLSMF